ncbi:uncharacterized protein [Rutidosis leptorrhynchoides]|uniref:uncharacterized protein n=1 Tax=Rutidosis leptorrhynchoides TaxID=125765 RepID=UPI003A98DA4F
MPPKLPISIVNLKHLYLGVSFMEKEELLCCFCLIKSSPNLTDLFLKNEQLDDSPSVAMNFLDLQERSNFKLDHLDKFEMINFKNLAIEINILKLVVTQAPVIRKVKIRLARMFYYDKELKIFKDAFPHASTSMKFKDRTGWKQWNGPIVELNF